MDQLHIRMQGLKEEIALITLRVDDVFLHLFGDHGIRKETQTTLSPTAAPAIYSSGLIPETTERLTEIAVMIDALNGRVTALHEVLNATRTDGGPARAVSR